MSGTEVLNAIADLKAQVQRIAEALEKANSRKEYQASYYKKRKQKKATPKILAPSGLRNLDRHCLEGRRDKRLPVDKWATVLRRFVDARASPYNFLTWLAWSWNKDTYHMVPITKSGGYLQVFIGFSGDKALRIKYSERELLGRVKVCTFSKQEQLEAFREAKWWRWGFGVLGSVVFQVEDEPWFKQLRDDWIRPLRVMMGGFGMYKVPGMNIEFDQSVSDLPKASKMYGIMRPTLTMSWAACLRGLHCKEEPFSQFAAPPSRTS